MFKKLITLLIVLSLLMAETAWAETQNPCESYSISEETLLSGLNVWCSTGEITALPGNRGLKDDEIKVNEDVYKISPEDLEAYKANTPGNEVKLFYKQTDSEKRVLMIQSGPDASEAEMFKLLQSLNIFNGYPDGTFNPAGNITRAEFSKIVVTASGYGGDVAAAAGDAKFSDMTGHWAAGYVNVASSVGVINGMGDGKFAPDENVTYEQAITMLVRMLGYEPRAKDDGGFPQGYLHAAAETGMTKDAEGAVGTHVTRGLTARLLFNSLSIPIMKQVGYKPVIYLYPAYEQNVSVKVNLKGKFTFTYPPYNNGWNVIAKPDGTIINTQDGMEYSYLFWEGTFSNIKIDLSKGFVVKGGDTTKFLQEKLSLMGLTPRERNEFIVYWAPKMHNNKYNLITFAGEEYEKAAPLEISPAPDSVLRVFMAYKPIDEPRKIEPQEIKPFERKGFTVIEWGGTEVN